MTSHSRLQVKFLRDLGFKALEPGSVETAMVLFALTFLLSMSPLQQWYSQTTPNLAVAGAAPPQPETLEHKGPVPASSLGACTATLQLYNLRG